MISKGFNLYQPTFNSFLFFNPKRIYIRISKDFNSYQIVFKSFSFWTQKNSKDQQGFQFMSIYFQLVPF